MIAARDDTRALYLNTPGLRVGRKDETLTVKDRDKLLDEVRLNDLTHWALFGNIQISTQAIQALCHAEIPLSFFSGGGWFYGITRGHGLKNVFLRIEQFRRAGDDATCLELARRFVCGKIRNHRTMLMRNHLEPPARTLGRLNQSADDALAAQSVESLLGIEGAAAAEYFGQFAGMIKIDSELSDPARPPPDLQFQFNFTHRNRRPPTDPINALLSLAYSLLSRNSHSRTLLGAIAGCSVRLATAQLDARFQLDRRRFSRFEQSPRAQPPFGAHFVRRGSRPRS